VGRLRVSSGGGFRGRRRRGLVRLLDDNVSLGAVFTDDGGNEAELNGEYELRVRLEDDADEIVEFDYHGDHVHIIGEEEGETEVVFQLWHDDHADFETSPIDVTVE